MTREKPTRAGSVFTQIRLEIFQGVLKPGQRLRLMELAQRLSVSQSVIREALTRLSGQGLVVAAPQQGFSVVTLSLKDLNELTEARAEIESAALRRAIERGGIQWEASVVAAHHHLAGTPVPRSVDDLDSEWFSVHEKFHQTLLEGAGNSRLVAVATSLRDAAELYRRWSLPLGHDHDRDVAAEHQALVDAVVSRDVQLASDLLAQHIDRTAASLRPVVQDGPEAG